MEKQITFYLFSCADGSIKSMTLSTPFLRLICVGFLTLLMSLVFLIYDYHSLKRSLPEITSLQKELCRKSEEISNQHDHLQTFEEKLNTVKSKLLTLDDFGTTLRKIANLEEPIRRDSLFGIGGSAPSDPDMRMPDPH